MPLVLRLAPALALFAFAACATEPAAPAPPATPPRIDARPGSDGATREVPPPVRPGVDAPVDGAPLELPAVDAPVADLAPVEGPRADAPAPDVAIAADAAPDTTKPAAQIPPQGRRLLDPWLAAGHYRAWKCEAAPLNPRFGSPHGRVRICSNDLASRHGAGPYPVGAASVKEIYYGARIGVYAVSIKVAPGTGGASWYWYEQGDLEGVGAAGCAGCHARAERNGGNDHVFVQVK